MSEPRSNRDTPTPEGLPSEGRFAELTRHHYSPALRYAQSLLRNLAEAEDCVQEAFAEAFVHLRSLRDPAAAVSWLRGIVRHRCLRRLRRRDLELMAGDDALDVLASEGLDTEPNALVERRTLAQRLLDSLPRHERDVVCLFYFRECSQREIASFLGIPQSLVNNRLHDARERMKKWEKHMNPNPSVSDPSAPDPLLHIGTVVRLQAPLVEARFDPGAHLDLFDALAVVGNDGKPVERMKVCHRLGDGQVLCLITQGDEPLSLGTSVLNTGQVGVELTPFRRVPGVSSENLLAAIHALRGSGELQRIETGIKAIDLLCPMAAAGVTAQVGMAGVGRIVLLDELGERLALERSALSMLCLVDRSEPDAYRGWDQNVMHGRVGGVKCHWALSERATDPKFEVLEACDAVIYLSPLWALRGLYPALDPEHSRSRLLTPEGVGAEHFEIAERARAELIFAKRAYADPVALELLACRAFVAARRRYQEFAPDLVGDPALRLARARRLLNFLTQPFVTAKELTGWEGAVVPLAQTLDGCRAILDGEVDELPEAAFRYAGTLDDVRVHARNGVSRQF